MSTDLITRRAALRTTAIAAVLLAVGTVGAPRAGFAGATGSIAPPKPDPALAFIGLNKGVCVMNADGSNAVSIVPGNSWSAPSWSPDARSIAFSRLGVELWRADLDGTGAVMLGEGAGCELGGYPAWSPLGHEIAVPSADHQQLLAFPAAGGPCSVICGALPGYELPAFVAWNSDGTRLAVVEHLTGGSDSIVIVDRASGAVLQTLIDGTLGGIRAVDWARLGADVLAFSAMQGSARDVYLVDIATGALEFVVAGADSPSFSPDNTWLAYESVSDGTIKKIQLATGRTVTLKKGSHPDWRRTP